MMPCHVQSLTDQVWYNSAAIWAFLTPVLEVRMGLLVALCHGLLTSRSYNRLLQGYRNPQHLTYNSSLHPWVEGLGGLSVVADVAAGETSLHVQAAEGPLVHFGLIVHRHSDQPFASVILACALPSIRCLCVPLGLANRDFVGLGGWKTGAWHLLH